MPLREKPFFALRTVRFRSLPFDIIVGVAKQTVRQVTLVQQALPIHTKPIILTVQVTVLPVAHPLSIRTVDRQIMVHLYDLPLVGPMTVVVLDRPVHLNLYPHLIAAHTLRLVAPRVALLV